MAAGLRWLPGAETRGRSGPVKAVVKRAELVAEQVVKGKAAVKAQGLLLVKSPPWGGGGGSMHPWGAQWIAWLERAHCLAGAAWLEPAKDCTVCMVLSLGCCMMMEPRAWRWRQCRTLGTTVALRGGRMLGTTSRWRKRMLRVACCCRNSRWPPAMQLISL